VGGVSVTTTRRDDERDERNERRRKERTREETKTERSAPKDEKKNAHRMRRDKDAHDAARYYSIVV
jgi:hypothetical protein